MRDAEAARIPAKGVREGGREAEEAHSVRRILIANV